MKICELWKACIFFIMLLTLTVNPVGCTDPHLGNNFTYNRLLAVSNNCINVNQATYPDGIEYWTASPYYHFSFVDDTWLAFSGYPDYFTANQIQNIAQKYINARNANGDFPMYLAADGAAGGWYSSPDNVHAYVTGDANFIIPQIEMIYYTKSGDITAFSANAIYMKKALSNIPRDSNNKLVYVPPATPWVTWGFQESVKKTGDDLMGSLLYYKAARDLSYLYTQSGDSTNATFFTNEANDIQNNISVALWDSTDGMFYAASANDKQIDIIGSAYAVFLGVANSSQTTAISNYLVNNYDTLSYNGFMRQSPTAWGTTWSGSAVSDDGYWSVGNQWIAYAMAQTSTLAAKKLIMDFTNGPDPMMEFYGRMTYSGCTNNLESPLWALPYAANTTMFPNEQSFLHGASISISNPFPIKGSILFKLS